MTDVAAVRRASAEDAKAVARLLHDFQVEFDEPTPEADVLAERYRSLLGDGGAIVLLAEPGPTGSPSSASAPRCSPAPSMPTPEAYVVRRGGGAGSGEPCWKRRWRRPQRGAEHIDIAVDESTAGPGAV
jgi:hypothetical protein